VDREKAFADALASLRAEGRYRTFAALRDVWARPRPECPPAAVLARS